MAINLGVYPSGLGPHPEREAPIQLDNAFADMQFDIFYIALSTQDYSIPEFNVRDPDV